MRGQCRECMQRAEVFPATRTGGGSYKRPNRMYRSSICGDCATRLLARWHPGQMRAGGWGVIALRGIVEKLSRPSP